MVSGSNLYLLHGKKGKVQNYVRLGCSFHYDWDARSCFSEPFADCVLGSTFPIGSCEIGEALHLSSFKEREKIKKDNEVG